MSTDTPAKDQDKFVLRLPDGMRERLKAEAEANKRSMNAEIIARLENFGRSDADEREIQELKDLTVDLAKAIEKELALTQAIYSLMHDATMKILNNEDVSARDLIVEFSRISKKLNMPIDLQQDMPT